MRHLADFYRECWNESFSLSWNAANGFVGALVGAAMTATVPITLVPAGFIIPNGVITFLVYFCAAYALALLFSFVFVAPYRAWKKERQKRTDAEETISEQLTPKIIVSYDPSILNCKRLVTFSDSREGISFRVKVSSKAHTICSGILAEVKNLTTQQSVELVKLSWSTLNENGPFTYLLPNIPQYLNVCVAHDINKIRVESIDTTWPIDALHMFDTKGDYLFHVLADTGNSTPAEIKLKLKWTGNWRDAEMIPC